MSDYLDILVKDAKATVEEGYYLCSGNRGSYAVSLRNAILQSAFVPIIAEVKGASPSMGTIRRNFEAGNVASAMAKGGAAAISVLTEPKHFDGSLRNLAMVREAVELPVLMKDIVVSAVQLDAAAQTGANAVLLIQSIFDRGYVGLSLPEMIEEAHLRQLEVLLEVHDELEFRRAISSGADLVGINNRNLATLSVDLNITKQILERNQVPDMLVVSESGVHTPKDIAFLRGCGADAFLIGSAVMSAEDVESRVREFAMAR